jgi:hypothetical protein
MTDRMEYWLVRIVILSDCSYVWVKIVNKRINNLNGVSSTQKRYNINIQNRATNPDDFHRDDLLRSDFEYCNKGEIHTPKKATLAHRGKNCV